MNIFSIIEKLENEPSSNGKLEILKSNSSNQLLKTVLYYTYNPLFNYYIKEFDFDANSTSEVYADLNFIFPLLDKLNSRVYTGNAARDMLEDTLMSFDIFDREIAARIVRRDIRCGFSAKTVNKVFPNLIPEVPYMRCSLTDKIAKINYPAIVQQKCDGMFVNVVYNKGVIKFFTRNGTEFDLTCLKEELYHTFSTVDFDDDVVFHGELLVGNDDKVESRKIGNGLINSLIKKEQTIESLQKKIAEKSGKTSDKLFSDLAKKIAEYDETDKKLRLIIWDVVDYNDWQKGESSELYDDRFAHLFKFESDHVKVVDYKIVSDFEEAQEFYREQISNGYEGAVLKNFSLKWKNHTSTEQIKLKAERECELKVIGYEKGTGKYDGGIGSLMCESSDGKLAVNVGSGLSDFDRGFERIDDSDSSKGLKRLENFDNNVYIGKIISVKFNEVIASEKKDTMSLFLPRFVEIREDKTEADSFETIRKM